MFAFRDPIMQDDAWTDRKEQHRKASYRNFKNF